MTSWVPGLLLFFSPFPSAFSSFSLPGVSGHIFPQQKEEPQREQGAKYSAETGRLIPASTWAMARRHSHQGRNQPASRDGGDQTFVLQDQELLVRCWEGWGLWTLWRPSSEGRELGGTCSQAHEDPTRTLA